MLRINLLTSINPAKLRDKINEIIHWMWRNELVPGHGIRIDRKVNGIIVSADPPVGGRSGNGAVSFEFAAVFIHGSIRMFRNFF